MSVESNDTSPPPLFMAASELGSLIGVLRDEGFTVIGPTVDQDAIVYEEIESVDELPVGIRDVQAPGEYRLVSTGRPARFEYNLGPHSWKRFLYPPRLTVQTAEKHHGRWTFATPDGPAPRYAFLGVRACELAAIAVQDRVLLDGPYVDPSYRDRRAAALIVAVNCTVAAATCFCTSMGTGPRCSTGFDLALTELDDGYVVEIGSDRGAAIVARLELEPASDEALRDAGRIRQRAVDEIRKRMDNDNIREVLLENLDHPRWDQVAERCLSCTNCTMVCPTCFCVTVTDISDLSGDRVHRDRQWDSCFNRDFSYTAGGVVRDDRRSRYRQWLTHKLATWHDQFETSGCVGCGRCITWCPVGIDLTEEVAAIRGESAERRLVPVQPERETTSCQLPRESP